MKSGGGVRWGAAAMLVLLAACGSEAKPLGPGTTDTAFMDAGSNRSLVVQPARRELAPGQSQQFTATVVNGNQVLRTLDPALVSWSTTGGTVDAKGMYQGTETPGVYLVIARSAERGVADTALVRVSSASGDQGGNQGGNGGVGDSVSVPPPDTTGQSGNDTSVVTPPIDPSSHEPAGYSLIAYNDFSPAGLSGWYNRGGSNFSILSDAAAPSSPPYVGRATFPIGFPSGSGPIYVSKTLNGQTSVYVGAWVRFSNNWFGNAAGMNKVFHVWIGGSNRVVLEARGAGNAALTAEVALQGINQQPTSINLMPNQGQGANLARGTWHHIELVLVANSAGNSNGKVDWWVDGRHAGSYANISFVAAGESHQWEEVSWNPTYGGAGPNVSVLQTMDMDDIRISGK